MHIECCTDIVSNVTRRFKHLLVCQSVSIGPNLNGGAGP